MRRFIICVTLPFLGIAARAEPPTADSFAGAWSYDAPLSAAPADSGDASPAPGAPPANAAGHSRGGGGGMGGGGMGGHGGGGHHHGDHAAGAAVDSGAKEDTAERGERGLTRMFAKNVTITPLKQRIRFDDGDHVIELDRGGMNVSGPGVGGTVALISTKPDIVVETLTDSGYTLNERYHVADDGRHLEMHVSLKRPGVEQPREFIRVFDRPVGVVVAH